MSPFEQICEMVWRKLQVPACPTLVIQESCAIHVQYWWGACTPLSWRGHSALYSSHSCLLFIQILMWASAIQLTKKQAACASSSYHTGLSFSSLAFGRCFFSAFYLLLLPLFLFPTNPSFFVYSRYK